MSLFSNLYVGTSGLQSSQEALNVVAHNVTNADTTGYVRQQVSYATREYNKLSVSTVGVAQKQAGLGVYISEVRQVRDRFVDQTYRNEVGRQGFYDASWYAIEEVEEIFGELDGPIFEQSMADLYSAVSELAKDPAKEINQSILVQYAQSFVEAAQNVYKDMSAYQDKINVKIADTVDKINALGTEIFELNKQIRAITSGGIENPNDLLDRRNQCLDELGQLGSISYKEDFYGNVLVKFEGHDFVLMNGISEMGYQAEDDESVGTPGFYNVFWKDSATVESRDEVGNILKYVSDTVRDNPNTGRQATGAVFNWSLPISSKLDTDVGELKGLVLARGTHRGKWTDLGTDSQTLEQQQDTYNRIADSVMVNTMAEFDGLVHHVVTAMNEVLSDAAARVNGQYYDGTELKYGFLYRGGVRQDYDPDAQPPVIPTLAAGDEVVNYGYMLYEDATDLDANGNPKQKAIQLFQRISCDDTSKAEDENDNTTWFSISNLYVNPDLLQYPTHLKLRLPEGSEDMNATATRLRDVFTDENYTLNPLLTNKTSLQKYYANFMAQIANSGNVYKNLKDNQDLTVEAVEANRQGSIGVATDEELSNMIRFQNAYNASSRFINVIDECMEHIINTLGH